jgi:hypothetical protein
MRKDSEEELPIPTGSGTCLLATQERRRATRPGPIPAYQKVTAIAAKEKDVNG